MEKLSDKSCDRLLKGLFGDPQLLLLKFSWSPQLSIINLAEESGEWRTFYLPSLWWINRVDR